MKKLKVGVIGAGKVAELHLLGYEQIDNVEVVACADINKARLQHIGGKWGLRCYENFEDMLKQEKLDIACICSPASTHRKITTKCAEYGLSILCEKPIAITLEDALDMIAACKKAGVKFYYGSSYRCLPPCIRAKEMIDAGEIGDVILMLETYVGGSGPEEWVDMGPHHYPVGGPGGGGMGIVDHGIHLVDIFSWFSKSRAATVFGRGNISGRSPLTEYLTIQFEGGAIGQLIYNDATYPTVTPYEGMLSQGVTWDLNCNLLPAGKWDPQPQCIHVHGTKGALRIYHYANKMFFFNRDGIREVIVNGRPNPGHFGTQIEFFANSILRGEEPRVTGRDGVRALQIILAAYESEKSEKTIHIKEILP
jgi:UDP-N-acetylglucosamine 3-dehydrogenase